MMAKARNEFEVSISASLRQENTESTFLKFDWLGCKILSLRVCWRH